eukprot:3802961-Karenia_brevis.AAC.1
MDKAIHAKVLAAYQKVEAPFKTLSGGKFSKDQKVSAYNMSLPESQRTSEDVDKAMQAVHDWADANADVLRSFVAIMSFGG